MRDQAGCSYRLSTTRSGTSASCDRPRCTTGSVASSRCAEERLSFSPGNAAKVRTIPAMAWRDSKIRQGSRATTAFWRRARHSTRSRLVGEFLCPCRRRGGLASSPRLHACHGRRQVTVAGKTEVQSAYCNHGEFIISFIQPLPELALALLGSVFWYVRRHDNFLSRFLSCALDMLEQGAAGTVTAHDYRHCACK
jgi:hypothetical protein